ncbi:MAG TPA: hypothetical protein VKG45_07660 [Actinomycetes bacterium]|nr:hypothetical protein [Actinomycetes bacterium]
MSWRLIKAELLKLRRRRGLLAWTLLIPLGVVGLQYGVLAALHAGDPAAHGPAGGVANLATTLVLLGTLAPVAAVLVGATAGAGDVEAGLFRDLVVTGRSRRALFAARVPGGLALLLPVVAAAWLLAVGASFAFAGGSATPGLGAVLLGGGWALLAAALAYVVALGLASLSGSRAMTVGVMLAWLFPVSNILLSISQLGGWRRAIMQPALERIAPSQLVPGGGGSAVTMSLAVTLLVLALWSIVPLVAGAWRTQTRDA